MIVEYMSRKENTETEKPNGGGGSTSKQFNLGIRKFNALLNNNQILLSSSRR